MTAAIPAPDAATLADIGAAVLNLVSTCMTVGHTTPTETIGYGSAPGGEDPFGSHVVHDLVAWSARRGDWQASEARLRQYVEASGYQRAHLERLELLLLLSP